MSNGFNFIKYVFCNVYNYSVFYYCKDYNIIVKNCRICERVFDVW